MSSNVYPPPISRFPKEFKITFVLCAPAGATVEDARRVFIQNFPAAQDVKVEEL